MAYDPFNPEPTGTADNAANVAPKRPNYVVAKLPGGGVAPLDPEVVLDHADAETLEHRLRYGTTFTREDAMLAASFVAAYHYAMFTTAKRCREVQRAVQAKAEALQIEEDMRARSAGGGERWRS